MSRFSSKQQLLDEIDRERSKLEALLASIPDDAKTLEVTDGMSVKDFLAHRAEWGDMMLRWYRESREGKRPAVPTEKYKWNQLKELNAEIYGRFADTPLAEVVDRFNRVQNELRAVIAQTTEDELFTKKHYAFTGTSDLATYFNSATAAHYRSAAKHIRTWWKARSRDVRGTAR
jgi:hypothetical protein